jgi:hypothetical protein
MGPTYNERPPIPVCQLAYTSRGVSHQWRATAEQTLLPGSRQGASPRAAGEQTFSPDIEWIAMVRDSLCEAVERAGPKLGQRSILEESVNGALKERSQKAFGPGDYRPGWYLLDDDSVELNDPTGWEPLIHEIDLACFEHETATMADVLA